MYMEVPMGGTYISQVCAFVSGTFRHLKESDMDGWIDMERWRECKEMQRPGYVFELRNAEGQSLFTPCTSGPPQLPFDWKARPTMFRVVPEQPPQHSSPMPLPGRGR
jgi:hypothetical protein